MPARGAKSWSGRAGWLAAAAVTAPLALSGPPAAAQVSCTITQITDSTVQASLGPSLDGSAIAFRSNADLTGGNPENDVEVFFYDGATLSQITSSAGDGTAEEVSLDGAAIAFRTHADLTGDNPEGNAEIFYFDGAVLTQMTITTAGFNLRPSLDAGSIAFSSGADLTGSNADGNGEIFYWDGVTFHQLTNSTSGHSDNPSLDGSVVAFISTADLTGGNADGNAEAFWLDVNAPVPVQITDSTGVGVIGRPSVDGAAIAFASAADLTGGNPDGNSEIFTYDLASATIVQITDSISGDSFEPSLSGGRIAFTSTADLTGNNADGNNEIFLFNGLSIVQITDSTALSTGNPSLDGNSIAFFSLADLTGGNPDGNAEIFLATCVGEPSPLEIPVAGPVGLAALFLLLLTAGLVTLRRTLF